MCNRMREESPERQDTSVAQMDEIRFSIEFENREITIIGYRSSLDNLAQQSA